MLDTKNEGFLTLEELTKHMRDYDSQSDHDAEKIFKALDSDQKGKIYFQDFLWAAMDIEKVLTPENLLHAFNTFAGEEHK